MPPRLEALQRLAPLNLCLRPAARTATPIFPPLVQVAHLSQRERKRKAKQDPYRWAQAQQRKNASLKRRQELEKQRSEEWGDPLLGKTTPFIESLASAGQKSTTEARVDVKGAVIEEARELPTTPGLRNFFLTDQELKSATQHAFNLTRPRGGVVSSQLGPTTEEDKKAHQEKHNKALEALRRITALENGNSKDRFHANVRRIIDEFGRHNTDKVLKPKPPSISPNTDPVVPRAGPDTGSSEVQIAILTAKIRKLHDALGQNRGYKDKHNARNLRLLVHKRQKLLRYMERKERGSERWTNMIEKLGITPAMWKDEITL